MTDTLVLGIETSCDETAAAVVARGTDGAGRILSNVVLSQVAEHAAFGGVVPEIAARAHVEILDRLVAEAMRRAEIGFADLSGIAATAGPGLIGGVIVGLMTAKAIAAACDLPLVAVNHLEGHALTPRLTDAVAFPYLLLLVSGGHTQFVAVEGLGRYRRIGTTIDDALGEAFDKTAKLLGLGYPGGPQLARLAEAGHPGRFALPRPMLHSGDLNFSFSGLKTAVLTLVRKQEMTDAEKADLCAEFQAAIVEVLAAKALAALKATGLKQLVVAGGVGANRALRAALDAGVRAAGARVFYPELELCTDNGAMIAFAGAQRLTFAAAAKQAGSFGVRPRWALQEV